MKALFLLLISTVFSLTLSAQKGNPEQKEAMKKLQWMIGDWNGRSTTAADEQNRVTNIKESVQPALDGTLLLINVRGTDKDSSTRLQSLAYTSFSVISYDTKKQTYRWTTWRNSGSSYDQYSFTVGEATFEYTSSEEGGKVRYKGMLGSNGEFLETGDYAKDNGNWQPFISMKLIKSN